MNIFWHLVWLVPLTVLVGFFISAYWPSGRDPKGPPYIGFDPGEKVTGTTMDDQAAMYQWSGKTLADMPRAFYRPGDPPGTYNILPGSKLHEQAQNYHEMLLNDVNKSWMQHPGQPCSWTCWSNPDGHRRETS